MGFTMKSKYDVVILGAGHNGLVCVNGLVSKHSTFQNISTSERLPSSGVRMAARRFMISEMLDVVSGNQ
jgi:predicted NAD/FAD-dependent oxidoreductase